VYGVGNTGKTITKLLVEKGVTIVGAIGHVNNVGRDLGEVVGLGQPLKVIISDNPDAVLQEHEADVAIVSVFSEMEKIYPILKNLIEHGLNVITLAEEAFYPWHISPELASKLDKLAKNNGVTVTASGIQDTFRVNMVTLLTGTCHKINLVEGKQRTDLIRTGTVGAQRYHLGETVEEFYNKLGNQGLETDSLEISMGALIADLGLTIKNTKRGIEPTIADEDIQLETIKKTVRKGEVSGTIKISDIDTEQGIKFRGEQIIKVYGKNEQSLVNKHSTEWFIKGIPDVHLSVDSPGGGAMMAVCAQTVNRIPDVLNCEPGYITADQLPKLRFRAFPLQS